MKSWNSWKNILFLDESQSAKQRVITETSSGYDFWLEGCTISGLYYKTSMIGIYDRNDSGLYYKTTITIVLTILAKARIVNYYDCKLRSKLKRNLWL